MSKGTISSFHDYTKWMDFVNPCLLNCAVTVIGPCCECCNLSLNSLFTYDNSAIARHVQFTTLVEIVLIILKKDSLNVFARAFGEELNDFPSGVLISDELEPGRAFFLSFLVHFPLFFCESWRQGYKAQKACCLGGLSAPFTALTLSQTVTGFFVQLLPTLAWSLSSPHPGGVPPNSTSAAISPSLHLRLHVDHHPFPSALRAHRRGPRPALPLHPARPQPHNPPAADAPPRRPRQAHQ